MKITSIVPYGGYRTYPMITRRTLMVQPGTDMPTCPFCSTYWFIYRLRRGEALQCGLCDGVVYVSMFEMPDDVDGKAAWRA